MAGLNIIQSIESDLVALLAGSPLMPPTVLVRPFEESLLESGRTFSNDNVIVRFQGLDFDSLIESDDVIEVDWTIQWEIMLILRDLRGHHAAFQLIETILFLLTDYKPVYSDRGMVPRSAEFTESDENDFRYFSIRFDHELSICERPYCDPYESVPAEVKCLDDCTKWLGLNEEEEYNICWRRYKKPGEDKYRFYNFCGQREGDEIENRWFAEGTYLHKDYGGDGFWIDELGNFLTPEQAAQNPNARWRDLRNGIIYGPSGPRPRSKFFFNVGLWRNTEFDLPSKNDGKFGEANIETNEE